MFMQVQKTARSEKMWQNQTDQLLGNIMRRRIGPNDEQEKAFLLDLTKTKKKHHHNFIRENNKEEM